MKSAVSVSLRRDKKVIIRLNESKSASSGSGQGDAAAAQPFAELMGR
jgi:hypothetical protein